MFDQENFHVFRDENAVKEKEKVKRTNLPRKAKNFSKSQLQLALKKKKDCNTKAQQIVEALLEPATDVDSFLLMLRDINQCHFEDVIQERAIVQLCGYPLCQEPLDNVPNQKYVISLATKKVFDITERKNFCGGQCYKASNYVKNQMLTSPLWLRDQEDIPEFRLLDGAGAGKKSEPAVGAAPRGGLVDLAAGGINTDDLVIVERTVVKEVVLKKETLEDEQKELEIGLSKLNVRD